MSGSERQTCWGRARRRRAGAKPTQRPRPPPGGQQAPLNPREHRPQPRVCSRRPQLAPVGECVSARPAPARKGSCLGSSSEAGPPGPRGRAAPALEGRGGRSSLCSDSRAARNRGHLMGHGARGRRVRFGIENSHLLPARLWPRRVPGPGINTLPSEPPSASTRSPGAGPGLPPPVSHGVSPLCAFHRERGGQRTAGCQAAARPAGPLTFLVADHVAISRHFDHKGGARGVRRETLARPCPQKPCAWAVGFLPALSWASRGGTLRTLRCPQTLPASCAGRWPLVPGLGLVQSGRLSACG